MTTFYLIRHGMTDTVGRVLAGRKPGFHLNEEGLRQAGQLPERFVGTALTGIVSSPIERARETAEPIAHRFNMDVQVVEAVSEVGYGDWTGRSIEELQSEPLWRKYSAFRTGHRTPGGETLMEVQSRFVGWMEQTRQQEPDGTIAVVSHADPIKTVVAHYAGIHLDMFERFELAPASVSVLRIEDFGPRLLTLNSLARLP